MFCPNCGHDVDDRDRFCGNCGADMEAAKKAAAAPSPPPPPPPPPPPQQPAYQPQQQPPQQPAYQPQPQQQPPQQAAYQQQPQQPYQPQPAYQPQPQQHPQQQPAYQQQPPYQPQPQDMPPQPPHLANVAAGQKKRRGGLIALFSILGVLLIAIVAFVIYSFPLRADVRIAGTRSSLSGIISDLQTSIKSNQYIRGVRYALNPADPNNPASYQRLDTDGGIFARDGKFPELELREEINSSWRSAGPFARQSSAGSRGNHLLYVSFDTLFGSSEPKPFVLERASALVSSPDPNAIRSGEDGFGTVTNELIVSVYPGVPRSVVEQLAFTYNAEIVGEIPTISKYQFRFRLPEAEVAQILTQIQADSNVALVQFNRSFEQHELAVYPNDSNWDSWDVDAPGGNNWGLEAIRAPLAWPDNAQLQPVSVGIVDGCIEYDHPDLQVPRDRLFLHPTWTIQTIDDLEVYYAKSERGRGSDYYDFLDHGTHVSGITGALGDNGEGISGVHWSPELMFFHYWHMNISADDGSLEFFNVSTIFELEATVTTLAEQGCRVLNYSLGDGRTSNPGGQEEADATQAFGDLCLRLEEAGFDFLILKAAGNENDDAGKYAMNRIMTGTDAARRHVVIVGSVENTALPPESIDAPTAVNRAFGLSRFSNYGGMVDVAAPGTNIYSTMPGGTYDSLSGTSMASPMAAGVAALIYAAHPEYHAGQVKAILMEQTDSWTTDGNRPIPIVNAALGTGFALIGDPPVLPPEAEIPGPGHYTEPPALRPHPGLDNPGYIPGEPTEPEPGPDVPVPPVDGEATQMSGSVVDITTQVGLTSFELAITMPDGQNPVLAITSTDGNFTETIPPAAGMTISVSISAEGYLPSVLHEVQVPADGQPLLIGKVEMIPISESQNPGTVSGRIIDAATGENIVGAEIEIREGLDNPQGTIVVSLVSDDSGAYETQLPAGSYTLIAKAEGYVTGQATVVSVADEERPNQDCTLTLPMESDQLRIVLTWGEEPRDLDSHLLVKLADGSETYTNFFYKSHYEDDELVFALDVDDTTSYGPETTTIYRLLDGEYQFWVHNFSSIYDEDNQNLSQSGCVVTVYAGDSQPLVFHVPPGFKGSVWHVFNIVDGQIRAVSEIKDGNEFLENVRRINELMEGE
ncbi:MAG: S8 family serine peptidase [Bacillota bacterium]|nr:S8 family serine peptidase [Bacillota bacterium]